MHNRWSILQLYRCYVIYAMNYWAIAFPCLMFLASLGMQSSSLQTHVTANIMGAAMGIALIYYQASQPYSTIRNSAIPDFGSPYYAISFSLNVILTLMIVIRLVLHSRNIRNAMGTADRASGLHKAIVTMLVESAVLYAVAFLIFIGTWGAGNAAQFIFLPVLAEVQVRTFFPLRSIILGRLCLIVETNR